MTRDVFRPFLPSLLPLNRWVEKTVFSVYKNTLTYLFSQNLVLMGDFNSPDTCWSSRATRAAAGHAEDGLLAHTGEASQRRGAAAPAARGPSRPARHHPGQWRPGLQDLPLRAGDPAAPAERWWQHRGSDFRNSLRGIPWEAFKNAPLE